MNPRVLSGLLPDILSGQCRVTLLELMDRFEIDSAVGALGRLSVLSQLLSDLKLKTIPGLDRGELDSLRILIFDAGGVEDFSQILDSDLVKDESENIEFKSSLWFDISRYESAGGAGNPSDFKSDGVLFSALKTIAAFANSSGGRLYIGVANDKSIPGLSYDFLLTQYQDIDRWQLGLRNEIQGKFKDGALLNDYIKVVCGERDGKCVVKIEVYPRPYLTFLTVKGVCYLFRRQGNRTLAVDISEIEEFLSVRWKLENKFVIA